MVNGNRTNAARQSSLGRPRAQFTRQLVTEYDQAFRGLNAVTAGFERVVRDSEEAWWRHVMPAIDETKITQFIDMNTSNGQFTYTYDAHFQPLSLSLLIRRLYRPPSILSFAESLEKLVQSEVSGGAAIAAADATGLRKRHSDSLQLHSDRSQLARLFDEVATLMESCAEANDPVSSHCLTSHHTSHRPSVPSGPITGGI